MTDHPPVSVCIVCRDEADRLGPCLDSVQWAGEILLLDLASTDGSAELAERYGARVVRRAEAAPLVELVRNEIAAEARHDWILALDPDERVTPGLAIELARIARTHTGDADPVDAVVIPRMNFDFGYPPSSPLQRYEPQLRMYRRSRVVWPTVPNALPKVPEERLIRLPPGDELVLVHDRSRNVTEVLERSVRYASRQAQSMLDRGERFTAKRMAAALWGQAYRHFFRAQAWRDGVPGLLRAGVLVGFHFYVWAAFWQLSGRGRTADDDRFVSRLGIFADAVRRTARVAGWPGRVLKRAGGKRQP